MALVDVTPLLHDPDFVDVMQVITRTPTVNTKGENTIAEVTLNGVGSVQPASGKTIQRLPENLQIANVSSFWFQGVIIATAPGKYPSIVVFRGQRYQVQLVMDWSNYGPGYTEGICVAEIAA